MPAVRATANCSSLPTPSPRLHRTESAVVYALNASDGSQRWHGLSVNGHIEPRRPAIGGGMVYITSTSGVVALDADDGSQRCRWRSPAAYQPPPRPPLRQWPALWRSRMSPHLAALGSASRVKHRLRPQCNRARELVYASQLVIRCLAPAPNWKVAYASEFTDGPHWRCARSDGQAAASWKGLTFAGLENCAMAS